MNDPQELSRLGFTLLRNAVAQPNLLVIRQSVIDFVLQPAGEGLLESRGIVYASRNMLDGPPLVANAWRQAALIDFLLKTLGPKFGVVRGLFFDKPPERSWSLPWHKDLSIAVADNSLPSTQFTNPTLKANVPHVIAPMELLQSMLTLRIHLDDVTEENGPLQVIPGSHRAGKDALTDPPSPETIYAKEGDVLAMRPLVSHASGNSSPGTTSHRRILHFEFAPSADLPDGYRWHQFQLGLSDESAIG